jgi:hypothetical protein
VAERCRQFDYSAGLFIGAHHPSASASGQPASSHRAGQLGDGVGSGVNVVADGPHRVDVLAGGVGDGPFFVAFLLDMVVSC